jgi:hypothetical protein
VPTPFTHLLVADRLIASTGLARELRRVLQAEQPAFLFGNIAPDVQTVSGQTREATHFFPVPLGSAPPAPQAMFAEYPGLGRPADLAPAQAAFMAGYLAHLVLDQLWVARIFSPVFGPEQAWGTWHERLYLHNVLRAHCDAQDLVCLPIDTASRLRRAEPGGWLPFVVDHHLRTWRDLVADQLGPGAPRTVEVFAERMKADPVEFAALLGSPEAMQRRVFSRLPEGAVERYLEEALALSREVLHVFWRGDDEYPRL